jgi:hypothetical protein
VFDTILPHFGVACSEAECAAMTQAARYDAKMPSFEFAPDGDAKRKEATEAMRAATERWLSDPYRRLEALRAGA